MSAWQDARRTGAAESMWPWKRKKEKAAEKEKLVELQVAPEEVSAEINMAEVVAHARKTMDQGLDRLEKEFEGLREEVVRIAEVAKDD